MLVMRRRRGCETTRSATRVVKPVPVKALSAWKWLVSRSRPVSS